MADGFRDRTAETTPARRDGELAEPEYGRFDFALTRIGTGFDDYFRTTPGWECVKRGKTAAFYRRKV